MPRYGNQRQLQEGTLVEILAHTPCPSMAHSVPYPHYRQLWPRMRVFIDWVTQLYDEHFAATKP